MSRTDYEARVGTVLRDKWTLERLIGAGGMAAVYEGRHKIGRSAAIKVLHAEVAMDKQVRARFEQEALAVNSVGHKGVVEIIDIDTTDDGSLFLVMELLEGETLADRVEKRGLLSEKAMLNVVDDVLDVLIACHKKDIVHRDIKPENLFLLTDGGVKVLDFGIARMRQGVKTLAGTMLGTVAFMPPEQIKGSEVDARADLFGLGATMFTCLAGRRIHDAESDAQLATKMLTQPAPAFVEIYPGGSEELALVVDRALAFLPERRYPDALTMRGDVWAVRRSERPPYAKACVLAGQSARDTKLQSEAKEKKTRAEIVAATRPQMPVFTPPEQAPSSAADSESAVSKPPSSVAATKPQMPAFVEHAGEGSDGSATPSVPSSSGAPSDEPAPSSDAAPSRDEPAADAEPSPKSSATDDEAAPASGDPGEPSKAEARTESDAPPSEGPMSLMPDSVPPPRASKEPDKPAAPSSGGQGWTILAIILALLAIGLFAAWRAGLINSPAKSERRSSDTPAAKSAAPAAKSAAKPAPAKPAQKK